MVRQTKCIAELLAAATARRRCSLWRVSRRWPQPCICKTGMLLLFGISYRVSENLFRAVVEVLLQAGRSVIDSVDSNKCTPLYTTVEATAKK